MASMAEFVRGVFEEGRVVHRGPPFGPIEDRPEAIAALAEAFAVHRLDVAGPAIDFDAASALAAAGLLRRSSWFLLSRAEPGGVMDRELKLPPPPRTAAEHLSADLMLRFLPTIHRRARAFAPGDALAGILAEALRRWPLSGVLSDLEDGPEEVGDLGGHPGLALLYAERLAEDERPGWKPRAGAMMDQVERVLKGLGRGNSPLLRPERVEGVPLG